LNPSLLLLRFAGLLQSGLSTDKALEVIGGVPDDPKTKYLLEIALESGSQVRYQLLQVAESFNARENLENRLAVVSQMPRTTNSLVLYLPLILLGLAQLAGFQVLAQLGSNRLVQLSVVLGVGLIFLAKKVLKTMVNRALPKERNTGMYLLGLALCFSAGGSLTRAQLLATEKYLEIFQSQPSQTESNLANQTIALSETTGSEARSLLLANAEMLINEEFLTAQKKVEKTSVRLTLPLGLIVLPAFVLVAIVPMSMSMLVIK